MRRDRRSAAALRYRRLYALPEWGRARSAQLRRAPWCERCASQGRQVRATVVNHRIPHKGERRLFLDERNHESCCKACHDGPVQADERRGFSAAVDASGWPTDPLHRANRG